MLGTRVQLLYAHPVTHAPCPYDNYHGGMPLLCSGPEKQPTGPISAICWLAAIPKRPEKNITATRHGSWQRGWLKQGSRGHAGDGDITASWFIYQQDDQGSTTGSSIAPPPGRKIARPVGLTTNVAFVWYAIGPGFGLRCLPSSVSILLLLESLFLLLGCVLMCLQRE